jgi:hypothetical protein
MKSRIFAVAAITAALALGLATPAFAESYTGGLSANSAAAGSTVEYTSDNTGQPTGMEGSFSLPDKSPNAAGATVNTAADVNRSIVVGEKSSLRFAVKVPRDAKVGSSYNLTVSVGSFVDQKTIKIVGASSSQSIASPSNLSVLWIALVAVVAGLLALFVAIRVRSNKTAA